ncbi:hypothetical protein D3C81_1736500 [compost metagenome]
MLHLQQLSHTVIAVGALSIVRQQLLLQTAGCIILIARNLVLRICHLLDPVQLIVVVADHGVVRVDNPAALAGCGPFIPHVVAARINDRR